MDFSRVDRLQSQIIREIADIVANELRDTPPAMITFTRSEVSKDLKYAKILFSVFGPDEKIEECMTFLKRHGGVIRKMVGSRMRIRFTPELLFQYDSSTENVLRVNEILEKLKRDEQQS
jgi:ribosome-binding factor A